MPPPWKEALRLRLKEPAAVVGIGNSASGDDAAGPEVVRLLAGRTRAALFDCGCVPENFIGPIARAKPTCIVLVDAAPAGGAPGAVSVHPLSDLREATFHTHAASPSLFLDVLVERTRAECFMIGIEPHRAGFGEHMSDEVIATAREVSDEIARLLPIAR